MIEIWKEYNVENYGILKVSDTGKVFSIKANKILSERVKEDNYRYVRVRLLDHSEKCLFIHRLVAQAFIPNPENKPEVNHKDFDVTNNYLSNLEWMTRHENIRYSQDHNRYTNFTDVIGEKNPNAKLVEEEVFNIRDKYSRGITIAEIALEHELGWSTISHVVNGRTWRHLL